MPEQAPAPPPTPQVKAFDRYGEKVLVPESDLPALVKSGGRAATQEEITQSALEKKYDEANVLQKAGGVALSAGAGAILRNIPAVREALPLPPSVEALTEGMKSGASAGLGQGLAYQTLKQFDPEAAAKYQQQEQDLKKAYSGTYEVGDALGMVGGAFIPGGGASAVGSAAERAAAKGLAGFAGRGVAEKAVATGLAYGAQGAIEGAIQGAGHEVGDQLLGDHKLAGEKIWTAAGTGALMGGVGGFGLGAGGSLLASGARGAVDVAGRALGRAEGAGIEATALTKRASEGLVDAGTETSNIRKFLSGNLDDSARTLAKDRAWAAVGDRTMAAKYAQEADKYLAKEGGTTFVGDTLLRHNVIDTNGGIVNAMREGTAADMLPKITAAKEKVGHSIGEITSASPARIDGIKVGKIVDDVAAKYEAAAATRPFGRQLRAFGEELRSSLNIKELGDTVAVQDLLRERKALDNLVFGDVTALNPKLGIEVKRELRAKMEELIVGGIDDAAKAMGKADEAAKLVAMKKDYQALRIAEDAAADTASKMSRNNLLGMNDWMTVGGAIASGHPLAAPVIGAAQAILRRRGNAAAAVILNRMADMGTLTRAVSMVDNQIGRAAKGVLLPPTSSPYRAPAVKGESVMVRANRIVQAVREAQADPQRFAENVDRQTAALARVSPDAARSSAITATRAINYLASKIPPPEPMNPLAGPMRPGFTETQAANIVRLAEYVDHPLKFFEDIEHGKVTPEGVEMIAIVAPGAFRQLQEKTLDNINAHAAAGKPFPYETRLRLGLLLGIAADQSLTPQGMASLQSHFEPANPQQAETQNKAPSRSASIKMPTQPSTLDRIEER